jgi:magnesium transporter
VTKYFATVGDDMPNTMVNEEITNLEREVRQALEHRRRAELRRLLGREHPNNIAVVLERVNHDQRHVVFNALSLGNQAEVLNELSPRVARQVLEDLPIPHIARILNRAPMDETARILTLFRKRQARILTAMRPRHREDVESLFKYPAQSAGRMMTEKFARVRPEWTGKYTLRFLRKVNADLETLTNLYATDEDDKLIGVVSLREVVTEDPAKKIEDLMNTDLVTVAPEADREDVAKLLSRYDYLAMPVVDPEGRMLGVITVDDVIDVLAAETTEDILKFGAVESGGTADESYFAIPIRTVISRRLGWLLLLFVAGTMTGSVLRFFEAELATVVALSFFIPLLIGTGGNTGAQTVSTLVRGLATGEVQMKDIWRVIQREFISGLLLGTILGVVAFFRAIVWSPDHALALAVGLGVLAICAWANTIAALIPLLAQRFKIDPATVSAPLITTLVDATGLAIYLGIAKVTLGL